MPPRPNAQDARPYADNTGTGTTDTGTTADRHIVDLRPAVERPVVDLREVCCGLVPAILNALGKVQADEVDVLIRAGMETEIISGFGAGGQWQLCFQASFGHALARFTRRTAHAQHKVRLDTLVY